MPILDDIRKALETYAEATSGVPDFAFENVKFDKTAVTELIECKTKITSRRPAVRGPNPQFRYQGIFQMTIRVPVNTGTGAASNYADLLLARFNGSSDILVTSQAVSIEYSEPADPYDDDPHYCYPVQVAFYAYGS